MNPIKSSAPSAPLSERIEERLEKAGTSILSHFSLSNPPSLLKDLWVTAKQATVGAVAMATVGEGIKLVFSTSLNRPIQDGFVVVGLALGFVGATAATVANFALVISWRLESGDYKKAREQREKALESFSPSSLIEKNITPKEQAARLSSPRSTQK